MTPTSGTVFQVGSYHSGPKERTVDNSNRVEGRLNLRRTKSPKPKGKGPTGKVGVVSTFGEIKRDEAGETTLRFKRKDLNIILKKTPLASRISSDNHIQTKQELIGGSSFLEDRTK